MIGSLMTICDVSLSDYIWLVLFQLRHHHQSMHESLSRCLRLILFRCCRALLSRRRRRDETALRCWLIVVTRRRHTDTRHPSSRRSPQNDHGHHQQHDHVAARCRLSMLTVSVMNKHLMTCAEHLNSLHLRVDLRCLATEQTPCHRSQLMLLLLSVIQ